MNRGEVILDASALLALIQEELGADIVRPLIKKSIMSTVNVAESLVVLQRANIQPKEALRSITNIVPVIIPFDLGHIESVAELLSLVKYRGLSLEDRICIALGIKLQLPIYTADKAWKQLRLENVDIKVIR